MLKKIAIFDQFEFCIYIHAAAVSGPLRNSKGLEDGCQTVSFMYISPLKSKLFFYSSKHTKLRGRGSIVVVRILTKELDEPGSDVHLILKPMP